MSCCSQPEPVNENDGWETLSVNGEELSEEQAAEIREKLAAFKEGDKIKMVDNVVSIYVGKFEDKN